jgi:hypothetical protein
MPESIFSFFSEQENFAERDNFTVNYELGKSMSGKLSKGRNQEAGIALNQ